MLDKTIKPIAIKEKVSIISLKLHFEQFCVVPKYFVPHLKQYFWYLLPTFSSCSLCSLVLKLYNWAPHLRQVGPVGGGPIFSPHSSQKGIRKKKIILYKRIPNWNSGIITIWVDSISFQNKTYAIGRKIVTEIKPIIGSVTNRE